MSTWRIVDEQAMVCDERSEGRHTDGTAWVDQSFGAASRLPSRKISLGGVSQPTWRGLYGEHAGRRPGNATRLGLQEQDREDILAERHGWHRQDHDRRQPLRSAGEHRHTRRELLLLTA